ncbi:exodeoxyribonuclease VII large subunit [bacterium]|nr:exodeoxyribonuclease VII large subunit [bacterium]
MPRKKKAHQEELLDLFKEPGEFSLSEPEPEEEADELKPQTVSELTERLQHLLRDNFASVFVVGEVSNFVKQSSGHYYFSLKDEKTQINAAMFRNANYRLKFMPENGMLVVVRGKVDIYPPSGRYQIICEDMEPCGLGAKQLQLEALKKKLEEEGLTSEDRKRPLPIFPKTVGFVTSASGSVLRDVKNVLFRRFPCRLVFAPALVQGEDAPASIIAAIENCNKYNEQHPDTPIDVLIVGRGGGSMEDLWCFNDEGVARAIAASKIPTVSAVGHETDWTVADLVADLRAPTPSAAAELVVQPLADWQGTVLDLSERLNDAVTEGLDDRCEAVMTLLKHYALREPTHIVETLMQKVDDLDMRFKREMDVKLERYDSKLKNYKSVLEAIGPLAVLKRGYGILEDEQGEAIVSADSLRKKGRFSVRMSDGSVKAKVIDEQ